MTRLSLRRPDADDATLLRRARRGDRRAHRLFARRHAARAVDLVELLVDAPADSATLAAAVLDATIAAQVTGDDALVRSAVQVLSPATGEPGLARLVFALTEIEGRTDESVADLVGRPVEEVTELRAAMRAGASARRTVGSDCRGWALAVRRDRLTVSEREAAHGHLAVCRSCRARLEEQRRTRDKLRISGGAVSAVVVADVVALSIPTGGAVAGASALASLVLGKAGVAVVGAAAVAIAATSTGVAVSRHASTTPAKKPSGVVRDSTTHVTGPSPVTAVPHYVGATAQDSQRGTKPSSTAPTTRRAPLPTLSPLPTSSLLPSLPAVLPTTLPTQLPTSITSLPPLPTATPTLPVPLPTDVVASATSLLGH